MVSDVYLHCRLIFFLSGSRMTLLSSRPLRTVRATFTAYGSSLTAFTSAPAVRFGTTDAPIGGLLVKHPDSDKQRFYRAVGLHVEMVHRIERSCSVA